MVLGLPLARAKAATSTRSPKRFGAPLAMNLLLHLALHRCTLQLIHVEFLTLVFAGQGAVACIVAASLENSGIDAVIAENPFSSKAGMLAHIVDFALGGVPPLLKKAKALYSRFAMWWLQLAIECPPSPFTADPLQVIQHISPRPIMLVSTGPGPSLLKTSFYSRRVNSRCMAWRTH